MCDLMSDLVIASLQKYGPTWHQMSSLRPGAIKQHKTKPNQTHPQLNPQNPL